MNNISSKKIIFIVPEYKFFLSHRSQLIQGLTKLGWKFLIVTSHNFKPNDEPGIRFKIFDTHRKRFSFLNLLRNGKRLVKLIKEENPCLIYAVSHRSIFLARIANLFMKKKSVYAISGMGSLFSIKPNLKLGLKNSILQILVIYIYRYFIRSNKSNFLLQNKNDLEFLINSKITKHERSFLIHGNGLEDSKFSKIESPYSKITFIMIARLLRDKGVIEFLLAGNKILKNFNNKDIEFKLYGDIDEANFNSLNLSDIEPYLSTMIKYEGFSSKIQDSITNSSVIVLPSYREGFSKVLMEAQACSRPVITSNVTGCKDAIIDNKTGYLVEPESVDDLVNKMENFINNPELIKQMGEAAYQHALKNFTLKKAIHAHQEMFTRILDA